MREETAAEWYQKRLHEVEAGYDKARSANTNSLLILLGSIAAFVCLVASAARWLSLLPLGLAIFCWRWHGKNRDRWLRVTRTRQYYRRGSDRVENRWAGSGFSGEEFRTPHHVYDLDLQITGQGSLFELLCTARTGIGRRRLAAHLLGPCDVSEARVRQEAVRELAPRDDLREHIALLGRFDFQESTWEVFSDWMDTPAATAPSVVRIVALLVSLALCLTLLAGIGTSVPWRDLAWWIASPFAVLMAIAWYFRGRTSELNKAASRVGVEIDVVRAGIEYVAELKVESARLTELQNRLILSDAMGSLRHLHRLTNGLTECAKPQFDLLSQAFAARTQLCFAIEGWKQKHGPALRGWLEAWGEFEALTAISGYARENPEYVYPEFTDGAKSFEATDLGHPLLPDAACVRNDVKLGDGNRFYVISGSNMSGKSTLLRSIGLAAVLAKAGAPVRARRLQLHDLNVFASLSIVDSVLEGKSKFLAEVERVRAMAEAARQGGVLFLIDEILSGTNSRDRRAASEAVVRSLIAHGAVGALSTHDLALTEIATIEGLDGSNVHMGSRPGGGPLDFDYLLKPGVTQETNALAIVHMMGL